MTVVAHPDDELLGLGVTMNRLISKFGVNTHVVILGEGITSQSDHRNPKLWEKELTTHKENVKKAQQVVGYHSLSIYDLSDNRFEEKEIFNPKIIFTHHGGDLNIDHQLTFEAVITATRPMEHENVKSILTLETPSGTEWRAERRLYPHPQSPEALRIEAQRWGIAVDRDYAEAFNIVRILN